MKEIFMSYNAETRSKLKTGWCFNFSDCLWPFLGLYGLTVFLLPLPWCTASSLLAMVALCLSWLTCPKSPSIVPSHLKYFWELFQDFCGESYILIFSLRIPLLTYHAYYFKNILLTTSICWVFLSSDALGLEYWDKVNLSHLKTFCVIGCTKNSSL